MVHMRHNAGAQIELSYKIIWNRCSLRIPTDWRKENLFLESQYEIRFWELYTLQASILKPKTKLMSTQLF